MSLLCIAALALLCHTAVAVQPDELTFPQLRDVWKTTGQFRIGLARGNKANPGVWTPIQCPSPLLGACTTPELPPLKQDSGDLVRVNYTFTPNGTMRTYQNMQPTTIEIRFCYSVNTSVFRAWRTKNKPYPRLSQNCPRKVATIPFVGTTDAPNAAANSGLAVFDFDNADEVPIATWFTMIWVKCGSQVCAFQSTEGRNDLSPPVPGNFFETDVEMGITKGMIVACTICSIIGPVFFFGFWLADHLHYKKTGKPIRIN